MGKSKSHCDAYGTRINLRYKGQDYFTTKWGTAITLISVLIYLLVAAFKLVEFFTYSSSFKATATLSQSLDSQTDLNELGFNFAIENIDKEFGTIKLEQVKWDSKAQNPSITEIELEECDSLKGISLSESDFAMIRNSNLEQKKFLCPSGEAKKVVEGDIDQEVFTFMRVMILACETSPEQICADETQLATKRVSVVTLEGTINSDAVCKEDALKWRLEKSLSFGLSVSE